jgi:hypothetical protein
MSRHAAQQEEGRFAVPAQDQSVTAFLTHRLYSIIAQTLVLHDIIF